MQGVRREIHAAPAVERAGVDEMPGLQKTGAQDHFHLQHAAQTQAAFDFRREKSRLHRAQKNQKGRI